MTYEDIMDMIESRRQSVESLERIAKKAKSGIAIRSGKGGVGVKDMVFLENQALFNADIKDLYDRPVPSRVIRMLLGDISQRQLTLYKEQGMPHDGAKYVAPTCFRWLIKKNLAKTGMTESDREVDRRKKLAATIKAETSATSVQIDLEERRGNLLSKNDIRAIDVAKIVRVRQALSGLGKEVSGKHGMGLVELGEYLDGRIREVCDSFAGFNRDDPVVTAAIVEDIVEYCRFVLEAFDNGTLEMGKFNVQTEEEEE